jgi:hypothetical protein
MPSKLLNLTRKLTWNNFRPRRDIPPPQPGQFVQAAKTTAQYAPYGWSSDVVRGSNPPEYVLKDNITITISLVGGGQTWRASWVDTRPAKVRTDLLKHEQGHYEIVALMARDLFIDLMKLKLKTYSNVDDLEADITAVHDQYTSQIIQDIQTAYDSVSESSHGANAVGQQRWNGYLQTAFTQERAPQELAPDGTAYKVRLLDVLSAAGVYP